MFLAEVTALQAGQPRSMRAVRSARDRPVWSWAWLRLRWKEWSGQSRGEQPTRRWFHFGIHHFVFIQSVIRNPSTLINSSVLWVTRIKPRLRACPAMWRSLTPI